MSPQAAIEALLAERAPGATICPSEAARLVAGTAGDWRAAMRFIHASARDLAESGAVRLSRRGAARSVDGGPYRIERA